MPSGSGSSLGMSFAQCSARSAGPSRTARATALVKAPLPPMSVRGPVQVSPAVVMGTDSGTVPGLVRVISAISQLTCAVAMAEARLAILVCCVIPLPRRPDVGVFMPRRCPSP